MINNNGSKELVAQTGQYVLVDTLPDGSVVTLNKRSVITYPSKFKGNSRAISLKGEAFFNVAPDKKKPFIISVNDVQVTVVGTSFNIKSENGSTEVVVETGIVQVAKPGKTVELIAGEKIVISSNDSNAIKEKVSDKLYNYYRSKEFVCDDTPLWKLVQVVNEAYNARIIIGNKELSDKRLTTTFNNESLEQVLEVIHLTFDITIVQKEDGQIILQ
jgi:ferric-dicitrate binding protein FerR (iron transport regulator)